MFQLGFATTQICELVSVVVQTLLAREMAGGGGAAAAVRAERVQHLINGPILIGGAVAGALSLLTFFQRDSVLRGLTTNAGIREASAAVFPVVLITQGESVFSASFGREVVCSFGVFVRNPTLLMNADTANSPFVWQ